MQASWEGNDYAQGMLEKHMLERHPIADNIHLAEGFLSLCII